MNIERLKKYISKLLIKISRLTRTKNLETVPVL